ncbi:MAG: hypothetical protein ACKO0Z_10305 [Betaproteobacteria bacterium]
MKRRGFLRALVDIAAAPLVARAAPLLPTPAPAFAPDMQTYRSYTFNRQPGFFDLVTYYGDGERKTLPRSSFEPTLIIVKCCTRVQSWYVLESDELPPELNLPGEQYVAYEFGEEQADKVAAMIKNSEHFIKV